MCTSSYDQNHNNFNAQWIFGRILKDSFVLFDQTKHAKIFIHIEALRPSCCIEIEKYPHPIRRAGGNVKVSKRVKSKQGEGVVDRGEGVKEKVDWPAASHVLIKRLTARTMLMLRNDLVSLHRTNFLAEYIVCHTSNEKQPTKQRERGYTASIRFQATRLGFLIVHYSWPRQGYILRRTTNFQCNFPELSVLPLSNGLPINNILKHPDISVPSFPQLLLFFFF